MTCCLVGGITGDSAPRTERQDSELSAQLRRMWEELTRRLSSVRRGRRPAVAGNSAALPATLPMTLPAALPAALLEQHMLWNREEHWYNVTEHRLQVIDAQHREILETIQSQRRHTLQAIKNQQRLYAVMEEHLNEVREEHVQAIQEQLKALRPSLRPSDIMTSRTGQQPGLTVAAAAVRDSRTALPTAPRMLVPAIRSGGSSERLSSMHVHHASGHRG